MSVPPGKSTSQAKNSSSSGVRGSGGGGADKTAADDDTLNLTEVVEERDLLKSRVFELENRLRETEEELEYYFEFFKKTKRGGRASAAAAAAGGRTDGQQQQQQQQPGRKNSDDSSSSSLDGEAPSNVNYTAEPWSKTLGRNAALEYSRDSPMFRKRMWAFQDTLKPLQGHTTRILTRADEYCQAGEEFRQRGVSLAEELYSKEASRVMFSNNFIAEGIGDLAANMFRFTTALKQVHELVALLVDSVKSGLAAPLHDFNEGFRDLDDLADELDIRGREYESTLSKALDQRELPTEGPLHDKAARARWDFELFRFDVVRYMNQLDSKKVLLLETGINNTFYALLAFFQGGGSICGEMEKSMRRRQVVLDGMNKRHDRDNALWAYVRSRLEAELQGELPPPGAPPGARAPINPRAACPVYVAELTTEVLSAASQEASTVDMMHYKDEGVLKQGYLRKKHVFGWKERCWYRLHASKLYTLELSRAVAGDVPVCVFDLSKGATVAKRPGKIPFCFLLVGDDGYRLELQAESEDEMLKWMAAMRRCQRIEDASPRGSTDLLGTADGRAGGGRKTIGLRAEALMDRFRKANPCCAECGSSSIEWASVNIGITLCEACATVHRALGSSVSTLRSLKLDPWSVFVLQSLVEDLGNERARRVWEFNVSPGWTKPTPDSGAQHREQWIIAKYRWYGFVGNDTRDPPLVSKAMIHAAARGDVERVVWCIAHKGEVNWSDPDEKSRRTPLHAACEADRRRAVAILLLNGANMYAKNARGVSSQDLVNQDPYSDLARVLAEKERGDLW
ncbi:unnamed protein product [Ectocarpus sp. 12 AP-2014]